MGSVWLAEHLELGTCVAVKLMDPELAATNVGLGRFKREAQAAASLDSPNIVRVFDFGIEGDTPYIVMELLKGESLGQRLQRVGSLELRSLISIYGQLGKAITKAHELGIVHRDLKPDNIFLVPDDDSDIAKVIDFGIAKRTLLAPGQITGVETRTGAMLGSPVYMSPEQASGSKDVDFRTDIWSLGIIAFECITGKRPYVSDSLGGLANAPRFAVTAKRLRSKPVTMVILVPVVRAMRLVPPSKHPRPPREASMRCRVMAWRTTS